MFSADIFLWWLHRIFPCKAAVAVLSSTGDLYQPLLANISKGIGADDLADLTEGDIKASIDLKGMSEGSYEVPVSIEIPKGYELVDEVTTGVEISKISTAVESN